MAEEEGKAEAKKGGNGMMIILIVLIVILLGAVGGIAYFLNSKGMFDPEDPHKTKIEQEDKKKTEVTEGDDGEKFLAKIEALVLNITDAKGRAKLMKLSFTMQTLEPTIATIVETNKAEIIDAVIRQVSARSSEELLTVGGKAMLKEEMLEEINIILNAATNEETVPRDSIKDIFFTSFVIK